MLVARGLWPQIRRLHRPRLLPGRGRRRASWSPWSVPTAPARRPSSRSPPGCSSRPPARFEVDGAAAGSIAARGAVSYLPDTPVFYDDLSLAEHLEYVAALHGVSDDGARSQQLLERLGLGEWGDSLASEFSHGMRQKASIALALVRPFSLLLADEPFDGLDPPSRDVLFELLGEAREAGAAVVVSTHRRDVVGAADRCLALRDGKLAYDGPPDAEALAEFFDAQLPAGARRCRQLDPDSLGNQTRCRFGA